MAKHPKNLVDGMLKIDNYLNLGQPEEKYMSDKVL